MEKINCLRIGPLYRLFLVNLLTDADFYKNIKSSRKKMHEKISLARKLAEHNRHIFDNIKFRIELMIAFLI